MEDTLEEIETPCHTTEKTQEEWQKRKEEEESSNPAGESQYQYPSTRLW